MGLLDILGSGTPQADTLGQGLLGLGAGLLSGGAYGAFGPALGRGFAGAQQGIQQGQINAYRNAQTQMLQQQLNMARQRQAGGLSLLSAMFGGAAPSAAPEPLLGNAASPAAPEPLLGNAPRPAPSDSLLGGTGATTYPVSTSGAASSPPPAISSAPMLSPNQKMRAAADWFFNNGKGISDILKPNIQNVRPGGVVFDATTGKPVFAAVDASGRQITYDANGNPVASTVPGWNQAVAATSQAQSQGAAAGKVIGERQGMGAIGAGQAADAARYAPLVKQYETTVVPGESTLASVDRAIGYIDRLNSAIDAGALNRVTGPRGQYLPDFMMTQAEANALGDLKSVQSKVVLNTMNEMRQASKAGATGFGNMNEQELKTIQDSLGSIQRTQDPTQIKANLLVIRDALRGIYNTAGAEISSAKGLYQGIPGIPTEPNLRGSGQEQTATKPGTLSGPNALPPKSGDMIDGWRFLGGDPSNKQSWQKVGG